MTLDDLVLLASLVMLLAFGIAEHVRPGYAFPSMPGWRLRAGLVSLLAFGLSLAVPMLIGERIASFAFLDLSGLGAIGGAVVAVLIYELGHYWYHRTMHSVPALWRIHQMHHAPERFDVWSAFYIHPIDATCFIVLQLMAFLLFGFAPAAIALAAVFLTFNAVFQHSNIRTPRWLGYIIERPEAHALHHSRRVHGKNYSDLPLWDMVFGTFESPTDAPTELGFYDGASERSLDLFLCRDVAAGPPELGREVHEREAPERVSVA